MYVYIYTLVSHLCLPFYYSLHSNMFTVAGNICQYLSYRIPKKKHISARRRININPKLIKGLCILLWGKGGVLLLYAVYLHYIRWKHDFAITFLGVNMIKK